jgi:hypothetical protein
MREDQSSWDNFPGVSTTTRADNITFSNGGTKATHRNLARSAVFDRGVQEQGLEQYKDTLYNPIPNNTVSRELVL